MKRTIRFSLVLFGMGHLAGSPASAQGPPTRIAVVDLEQVVARSAAGKALQARLAALQREVQAESEKVRAEQKLDLILNNTPGSRLTGNRVVPPRPSAYLDSIHQCSPDRNVLNTAQAKGLAERRVAADRANWTVSHMVTGANRDEVGALYRQAEEEQRAISDVLTKGGLEECEINEVKPEMLEEAARNAKIAASEFAENAGVKVGRIRSARQDVFEVRDAGSSSGDTRKLQKDVRVVITVDFYLTD